MRVVEQEAIWEVVSWTSRRTDSSPWRELSCEASEVERRELTACLCFLCDLAAREEARKKERSSQTGQNRDRLKSRSDQRTRLTRC